MGELVPAAAFPLTEKWNLARRARFKMEALETAVEMRTRSLEEANRRLKQEAVERERMEGELRMAHRLEAVGQLAAGVAHEINTPIQFIGDSVTFLRDACRSLEPVLAAHQRLCLAIEDTGGFEEFVGVIRESEETADLAFLCENIPPSIERIADGTGRVASIVRSLKHFAHPDAAVAVAVDLNSALESTLILARSEYKYLADVETDLGLLPAVLCFGGDLNQVFLNLIVNAAHAIKDVVGDSDTRGKIRVQTFVEGADVVVAIGDTGAGIPSRIQDRIFDPFFTTKEVGRGTGQGLSIARAIVIDKHKGSLTFETQVGHGTTFFIRIPIGGPELAATRMGTSGPITVDVDAPQGSNG